MQERQNQRQRQGQSRPQDMPRQPVRREQPGQRATASGRGGAMPPRERNLPGNRGGSYSENPYNAKSTKNTESTKSTKSTKKDSSGLKKLGIIFVISLLLSGSIFVAIAAKDKLLSDRAGMTSAGPATVNVTFPEGRTVRQYGALLESNGVCSAEDFYSEMRTTDFTGEYSFLPTNDILQQREYPLEGYLYPDTYTFYIGENPKSVIKRFLQNFAVKISDEMVSYANSNGEGFNKVNMSFDSAVILASIIERESPDNSERDKIAAVFWNRMENPTVSGTGGKLQSDATHYYPYVVSDERPEGFRSEYDTYDIAGLPKGPICSPSVSSIKAAVYPDVNCKAYFFFNDNQGNHYYAETYEEHKKNIQYCKDNGLA